MNTKNRNSIIKFNKILLLFGILSYSNISFASRLNTISQNGLPDLILDPAKSSVKVTPKNNAFIIDISAHILSTEKESIYKTFRIGFYLTTSKTVTTSDKLLAYMDIPPLCGNCWYNSTYNLNLAHSSFAPIKEGTYFIGVIVDDKNAVPELSENNNSMVIDVVVNYSIPAEIAAQNKAEKEFQDKIKGEEQKAQLEQKKKQEVVNINAGKVLFGLGSFDVNDITKNTYKKELSMKDIIASNGSDGDELSFLIVFKKPLKEQFELYRNMGLDKNAWQEPNWVNLYFKLIIDNKETIISKDEFENVSFKSNTYQNRLLGKYASGKTLQLQRIFLDEIYKLTPGTHNLKIETYVKSTSVNNHQIGPEIIAEGELKLNITSEDKIAYYKKANGGSDPKPAAKMKNAALEAQIKKAVIEEYKFLKWDMESIQFLSITDSDWSYIKNQYGVITYRKLQCHIIFSTKDGSCKSSWLYVAQDKIGNDKYGELVYNQNISTNPIPCEVMK